LNSWVFGDDDDGDRIGEEGERGEGDGRRFGSSLVRVPGKENKKRQSKNNNNNNNNNNNKQYQWFDVYIPPQPIHT